MKKVTAVVVMLVSTLLAAAGSVASEPRSKSYEVESVELQIPSRGIEIPATVVTPVGKKHERFPLVVIHHGHGGGRNENGGLAGVADALARAGIASIRFDFAGAGDSTEPFTQLSYTTMLADSNAALVWAVRNLPIEKDRIGGFGYSEGSAVVAMQAGQPFTPYQAVALLGPLAHPAECRTPVLSGSRRRSRPTRRATSATSRGGSSSSGARTSRSSRTARSRRCRGRPLIRRSARRP
jgi:uncharacterized protein